MEFHSVSGENLKYLHPIDGRHLELENNRGRNLEIDLENHYFGSKKWEWGAIAPCPLAPKYAPKKVLQDRM